MPRTEVTVTLEIPDDRAVTLDDEKLQRYFTLCLDKIDVPGTVEVLTLDADAPDDDEHAEAPDEAAPDAVEAPATVDSDADTRELEALSAAGAGADPQPEPAPHAEAADESEAYRAAQARKVSAATSNSTERGGKAVGDEAAVADTDPQPEPAPARLVAGGREGVRQAAVNRAAADADKGADDDEPLDLPDDDGDGDELEGELPDVSAIEAEGGDGPQAKEAPAAATDEPPAVPEGVTDPAAWRAAQARKRRRA